MTISRRGRWIVGLALALLYYHDGVSSCVLFPIITSNLSRGGHDREIHRSKVLRDQRTTRPRRRDGDGMCPAACQPNHVARLTLQSAPHWEASSRAGAGVVAWSVTMARPLGALPVSRSVRLGGILSPPAFGPPVVFVKLLNTSSPMIESRLSRSSVACVCNAFLRPYIWYLAGVIRGKKHAPRHLLPAQALTSEKSFSGFTVLPHSA